MDVSCARYIEYDKADDLKEIDFNTLPQPVLCIGGGSNLLFTADFPGTVLHSKIKFVKYVDVGLDEIPIAVGAGVTFDDLVKETCGHGLWGLENLSLIPGDVGGAAVQNIGAYGVEIKDVVSGVVCYDIQEKKKVTFKKDECAYAYRSSRFKEAPDKGRYIITSVLFRLSRKARPQCGYQGLCDALGGIEPTSPQQIREEVIKMRQAKLPDPAVIGSAGSFFKNPVLTMDQFLHVAGVAEKEHGEHFPVPHYDAGLGMLKVPAAWLIEQCGLKGKRIGQAAVYEKQALVIVNDSGSASPEDILNAMEVVTNSVREKFSVSLTPEVEIIQ